jgi:hypothetical protein
MAAISGIHWVSKERHRCFPGIPVRKCDRTSGLWLGALKTQHREAHDDSKQEYADYKWNSHRQIVDVKKCLGHGAIGNNSWIT